MPDSASQGLPFEPAPVLALTACDAALLLPGFPIERPAERFPRPASRVAMQLGVIKNAFELALRLVAHCLQVRLMSGLDIAVRLPGDRVVVGGGCAGRSRMVEP